MAPLHNNHIYEILKSITKPIHKDNTIQNRPPPPSPLPFPYKKMCVRTHTDILPLLFQRLSEVSGDKTEVGICTTSEWNREDMRHDQQSLHLLEQLSTTQAWHIPDKQDGWRWVILPVSVALSIFVIVVVVLEHCVNNFKMLFSGARIARWYCAGLSVLLDAASWVPSSSEEIFSP